MMYIYKFLYISVICFALYSLTGNAAPPDEDKNDDISSYQITKASHNLAKITQSYHKNIVFCPQGVNVVERLAAVIPTPVFPVERTPDALQDAFDRYVLKDDNDKILKQANFVFSRDSLSQQDEDLLESKGNPHIFDSSHNLKHAGDVADANRIIAKLTDNALEGVIRETDNFDFIVTNIVYFKGKWGVPCEKGGALIWKKNTAMLEEVDSFVTDPTNNIGIKAGETDGYNLFSLPVNEAKGKYKFIIAVPEDSSKTTPEQAILNDKIALNCIKAARSAQQLERNAFLTIPVFYIQQKHDLNPLFKSANRFEASQDVFIQVNEKGVEAAAYTKMLVFKSISLNREIKIDKPFAYWIINAETDKILFMGTVYDPEKHIN
ncbi:MAG: hypothetical protein OXD32_04375 [Endozoicomonadaceae bacterium]|nr:hypothetical protein [Endozoicomonadaceae bacterium]